MNSRHQLLEQWSKGMGEVAARIGQPGFPAALLEAMRRLVEFDFFLAFAFRGDEPPLILGDTLDDTARALVTIRYAQGPFLLDPFYQRICRGWRSGCYRLRDVAPDHFSRSEYYRVHYGRTGIGDEISLVFPMTHGFTGNISFGRWKESPRINRGEAAIVSAVEPAIRAFCGLQWEHAGDTGDDRAATPRQAEKPGIRLLSAREREIVSMILQGHSTESVALHLDISPGTVKIHRKNIYRKLGISTQAELFAAFLGRAGAAHAPVAYSPGDIPPRPNLTHARVIKITGSGGAP